MNRLLINAEYFIFNTEIWCRLSDGSIRQLDRSETGTIDEIIDCIATFYPKAYDALCSLYKESVRNQLYYRYRIAARFIRCNFAQLDDIPDFSSDGRCNFEYVPCPLRGECRHDHVICHPEFDHKLSSAEMPVMHLWAKNSSIESIAEQLCLSPHTIHNHIRNAYRRINVHSRSEFVRYAIQNHLFS